MPFISVIVPVYNVEDYISRCFDSLYCQELDESQYEVIVVNDGTQDHSMDVVKQYAEIHQNIVIHHKENGGVSSARNAGIRIAKGDYLIFVDPDDAIEKNVLKSLYSKLHKASLDILILNSFILEMDSSDKEQIHIFPIKLSGLIFSGVELFQQGYLGKGSVWGAAFKKKFIWQNGIEFPESVINGEDTLFMAVCFAHAARVMHVSLDFYNVFQRAGSASQSWNYERVSKMFQPFNDLKSYFEKHAFSVDQMDVINFHMYITFSNIMNRFFAVHCINKYTEVRRAILGSGFYPVKVRKLIQRRYKISILNCSFELYCLPFFFRQLVFDFLKRVSK